MEMRPATRLVVVGAVLAITGLASFMFAHHHGPIVIGHVSHGHSEALSAAFAGRHHILRIGALMLMLVGVLLVATGLIRRWFDPNLRSDRRAFE